MMRNLMRAHKKSVILSALLCFLVFSLTYYFTKNQSRCVREEVFRHKFNLLLLHELKQYEGKLDVYQYMYAQKIRVEGDLLTAFWAINETAEVKANQSEKRFLCDYVKFFRQEDEQFFFEVVRENNLNENDIVRKCIE